MSDKETERKLVVGDVVVLNSGDREMTVVKRGSFAISCLLSCCWELEDGRLGYQWIHEACLRRANP